MTTAAGDLATLPPPRMSVSIIAVRFRWVASCPAAFSRASAPAVNGDDWLIRVTQAMCVDDSARVVPGSRHQRPGAAGSAYPPYAHLASGAAGLSVPVDSS